MPPYSIAYYLGVLRPATAPSAAAAVASQRAPLPPEGRTARPTRAMIAAMRGGRQ